MRSIRLSLVVSFLALLALALGAVSVLVYRTELHNLRDKQKSMGEMLRKNYQDKLDNMLRSEASTLANVVKVQVERRDWRFAPLHSLGILSGCLAPDAPLSSPLWLLQARDWNQPRDGPPRNHDPVLRLGPLQWHLWAMGSTVRVKGMVLPEQEGQLTQFVQINGLHGTTQWRSKSLGERSFAFDPRSFSGTQLVEWRFDDPILDGSPLRRVVMKVSRFHIDLWGAKGMGRRADGTARLAFPPLPRPTIFIQGAYDKSRIDGVLGRMQQVLAQDLDQLEQSSQEALAALRHNLLAVSMGAFVAVLLGGFWLVRLGLAPLQRLSDAVSRVSEKDFRLPLDGTRLPAELRPIVGRLEQTLDLLKRAFAREKQAAADLSHELRTPLAALLTTLDVALRKPRSAEEYRELLQECRSSGQHMYGLVERLLTLARLDAGVDHVRPHAVDVGALAEQCAALVRPLAEARGLSLRVHNDGAACVTADPDKLREVVTNLLHNAIEYNRPDGAIDVAVARHNGDVRVEVRDTGIGISPEARLHIFERFYRSDPSRQSEGLHAGLGLAIVKGYIDLMGGAIDVESTQGQGSTFSVRLPARPAAAGA